MSEHEELNQMLAGSAPMSYGSGEKKARMGIGREHPPVDGNAESNTTPQKYCQWATSDDMLYMPASKTQDDITPGVYEIACDPQIGIFFKKIPVKTEGLIRFPDGNSDRVVGEIQKFWERDHLFMEYGLSFKRGILLYGPPGCHAAGTKVVMFDGSTKNVEDVVVGDVLMGADSKPRVVLDTISSEGEMYEVMPKKGEPFVVNSDHILSLVRSRKKERNYPETLNIKVSDYLKLSKPAQESFKLRRVGVNYFSHQDLPLDPYFLGVWLGDGTECRAEITTEDVEIVECVQNIARHHNCTVTEQRSTSSSNCKHYTIVDHDKPNNSLLDILRELNVLGNKHIPEQYLLGSRRDRLGLLAGLIDTDGGYETASWRNFQKFKNKGYKGYFGITQKRENLARQIVFLARSLGLGVTIKECVKTIKKTGFSGKYWRVCIFGEIAQVPTRLSRKKALIGRPNKDPLRTGVSEIKSLGKGAYYGFTLSGDHLYLTDDFIVHHNSGKSCTVQLAMSDVIAKGGIAISFTDPGLFIAGLRIMRQIQPKCPVVTIMEDIESLLAMYSESEILNILDGVNQVDYTVFLATTNYPQQLGARIVNRPSRFDKRFRIGMPSIVARRMYFESLVQSSSEELPLEQRTKKLGIDLDQWVKDTADMSIAHLKELFIAVVILGDDYKEAVDTLKTMTEPLDDRDYSRMGYKQSGYRGG